MTRIEYFYLIRHIPSGKFYAGSKYANNYCNPDLFWNKNHKYGYFTGSKLVKFLIEKDGIDSFEVLEIIPRPLNDARDYEAEFLKSVGAAKSDKWLNNHNGNKNFQNVKHSPITIIKISNSNKGLKRSNETKCKISKASIGRIPYNKGKSVSEEIKQKISISCTGRILSEETKTKQSNSHKGKIKSIEHRKNLSLSHANKPPVICPHCNKSGKGSSMYRWHFDNCRLLIT